MADPASKITPAMQLAARAEKRKSLKKGRKPKGGKRAGKKGKGKAATAKSTRNRSILKQGSPTKTKTQKKTAKSSEPISTPSASIKAESEKPSKQPRRKAKAEASKANPKGEGEADKGSKVYQSRVVCGKTWRYEVLPDQVWGCSNCRFIHGGCASCKKPGFKGKTAAALRAEVEAGGDEVVKDPVKKAKRVRKAAFDKNEGTEAVKAGRAKRKQRTTK